MSCNNDMPLSIKSDTFGNLCDDFDQVLKSTLTGMVETDQASGEISLKVKILLTEDSAPDYSIADGQHTREITKPKFEHTVTAVSQRKEKKTGVLSGEYELVWDPERSRYVMRPLKDMQMNIFDSENEEYADGNEDDDGEEAYEDGESVVDENESEDDDYGYEEPYVSSAEEDE